jgi:hypothetical protein
VLSSSALLIVSLQLLQWKISTSINHLFGLMDISPPVISAQEKRGPDVVPK